MLIINRKVGDFFSIGDHLVKLDDVYPEARMAVVIFNGVRVKLPYHQKTKLAKGIEISLGRHKNGRAAIAIDAPSFVVERK